MYAEIELGGKTRRLRYDYNAIADVEEKSGLGIGALFNEERAGLHSNRMLIWGGLKWADRGLTVARVGGMLNEFLREGGDMEELMDKVKEALGKSGLIKFEEVDGDEGDEGNPEAETAS